jgi:hypothetical protein
MEPIDTHSPQPPRASLSSRRAILLALAIGIPLLACCGYPAYIVYEFVKGPYVDSVVWHYDDFRIVGAPERPGSLRADGTPPGDIAVQSVTSRFISPKKTVIETGPLIELSTITWESANAASSREEPTDLGDGTVMVRMLDGTSRLQVIFEAQEIKSVTAYFHLRIHNTSNGQWFELQSDDWSAVERVFGKPKTKEQSRHYVGWGAGS